MACLGIRDQLIECVANSKCVKEQGGTFHDCLRSMSERNRSKASSSGTDSELQASDGRDVPSECAQLRRAYFDCRRNQVRPRARVCWRSCGMFSGLPAESGPHTVAAVPVDGCLLVLRRRWTRETAFVLCIAWAVAMLWPRAILCSPSAGTSWYPA